MKSIYQKTKRVLNGLLQSAYFGDDEKWVLMGRLLSRELRSKKSSNIQDFEFGVFSQWGDDGIIQFLISNLEIDEDIFVEFGVEDYREANTRFLMMNNNWSGLVIDASKRNIDRILSAEYYWKYDLKAKCAFVDRDNINDLILEEGIKGNIGLLHIDIDGNDYWIWEVLTCIDPIIVIVEYNSLFGKDRAITIPYERGFQRNRAHSSNLFYGTSLKALLHLGDKKGYAFIGCNSAGNNAYFVRRDKLNDVVKEVDLDSGYVLSKFRESRNTKGDLTFIRGAARINIIKGLGVYNILSNEIEEL